MIGAVLLGVEGAVDTSKMTAAEIEATWGEGSDVTRMVLYANGLRSTSCMRRELYATDWFDGSERKR